MAARVVIVTGANSGVGFVAAQMLAEKSYDVIMACRSQKRAEEAMEQIKAANQEAMVTFHECDFADLSSVASFADWFLSTGKPLYALLNNAGVLMGEGEREVTKNGFEMTFGVNHLGHFLLTLLLLEKLKSSVELYGETRIVHVGSGWHDTQTINKSPLSDFVCKEIDFEDLNLEKEGAYKWTQAYKNSKAAQMMFSQSLAKILEGSGVTSNTCSPGFIPSTSIFRNLPLWDRMVMYVKNSWLLRGYFKIRTLEVGGEHLFVVVHDEKFKGVSGTNYKDFTMNVPVSAEVDNTEHQKAMWNVSCDMIKRPDFKNLLST